MKKILLIEDNLEMRENTAEILELNDFEVVTAENGVIGIEKAKKDTPDLIICDVMMPELDGYGVLYLLSKDPSTASIPFIFLTAKAEKSDLRKGMNLGADDYITKPFDDKELLEAVDIRLKRSEAFKTDFDQGIEGLSKFIDEAKGLEELKTLSLERKPRTYKKKETIFHEGDFPSALYYVNKGKVKTFKMNEDGKELITGLHKSGDFLGYMALLQDVDYNETAVTLEEAEVYALPKDDFLNLIYSNRDVSSRFIKLLANNLIEKEEELLNLAYNTVRKRVADALLLLMKKYRGKETTENFSMPISRDDLASIVGTATESVIRTLSEFKEEKLIEIKASRITILDADRLKAMRY